MTMFTQYEKNKWREINNIIISQNQGLRKAVIITPTIGKLSLKIAIESVLTQDYESLVHLIVIDGECHYLRVNKMINEYNTEKILIIKLPFNTGQGGFNGHRIYAAISYLINSDYIFFLDEDNWLDTDHVSSIINLIETKELDWAYSMRKIYNYDYSYIADDNCESIGKFLPFSDSYYLIDTNCYGLKRQTLTSVAHLWYHPLGADRYFFRGLDRIFPKYECTNLYTTNYLLTEGRHPNAEYFLKGNQYMMNKYNNRLPWIP